MLKFHVYKTEVNISLIVPYIYRQLLTDLIPDYEKIHDLQLFQYLMDKALHSINKD